MIKHPAPIYAERAVAAAAEQAKRALLTEQGFYIEDMGEEWGPEHAGRFRWMNSITGEFQQDWDWSSTPTRAWEVCVIDNQ